MQAHERAAQIWPVLSYAASHRQTLTYEMLGNLVGVPRFGLAHLLEPVQSYCLVHGLPALTVLVVKQTGRPGDGFIAAKDVPVEQERVFSYDWLAERTPTAEDLKQAVNEHPSCGKPDAANVNQSAIAEVV